MSVHPWHGNESKDGWGRAGKSPGISCALDAFRVQELLHSVARVMSSHGLGGDINDGKMPVEVGKVLQSSASAASTPPMPPTVEGGAVAGPSPIVSVALDVLLVIRPSDVAGEGLDDVYYVADITME